MTAQGLGLLDPTNCWKIRANSQYTDKEFPYCCVTHWNHCQHNWIRCQDTKRPWIVGPRKAGPNALLQGINKYQKKKNSLDWSPVLHLPQIFHPNSPQFQRSEENPVGMKKQVNKNLWKWVLSQFWNTHFCTIEVEMHNVSRSRFEGCVDTTRINSSHAWIQGDLGWRLQGNWNPSNKS